MFYILSGEGFVPFIGKKYIMKFQSIGNYFEKVEHL